MRAWGILLAIATLAAAASLPAASARPLVPEWEGTRSVTVLTNLFGPIDFALAPDGSVWWNEYYSGNVTRWDPRTDERTVVFHAPPIPNGVERGMLGLALDPDVLANGVFYVYYTVADPQNPDGGTNRLSRIAGSQETVLLTLSADKLHNGGRIAFAPDGSLVVTTGENNKPNEAQNPESFLGKVLRLWPDGRPHEDNLEGHVFSMGHRNLYGLAIDPDGRIFVTENSNAERDEVNLVVAGGNYGWPHCEGTVRFDVRRYEPLSEPCDDPRFVGPIGEFYPTGTAAPTGAGWLRGALHWASWNEGAIHRMTEGPAGAWTDEVVWRVGGRINDLEAGLDEDTIWYSNWTSIVRLELPPRPDPDPDEEPPGDDGNGGNHLGGTQPPNRTAGPGVLAVVLALLLAGAVRLRAVDARDVLVPKQRPPPRR